MSLTEEKLLALYRTMVKIRKFEERVASLYASGEIPGFVHLYIGQEAIATGVCYNLRRDDFITSTHRGHGHLIAKGGDVKRMMAELYGKRTGYCRGKGGSLHIATMEIGVLGANGIVGGGIPIAVGAGYSIKLRGTDQVAVAFFGDAATNEGVFHESLNMAAAWNLPVIFVCEYNKYGVSAKITRVTKVPDLEKRAIGYGIPGIRVDGNDVLEVEKAAGEAIARARRGEGPTFIVADTFRYRPHFEGDKYDYVDKEELEYWRTRDPLSLLRGVLETRIDREKLRTIENEVEVEILEAVEFARKSPEPAPEEALEGVFSEK
jgi:pyruvate dehydrogenase E1 component alpha subunit